MTTLHLRKSSGRSPLRLGFLLIALVLACFGLSPTAQTALPPPAPDGGYINDNTAEGKDALFDLTTGTDNTAIGSAALTDTTKGSENTAIGTDALSFNSTGNANTATGVQALQDNTSGGFNTATGLSALFHNTTGANNTANGLSALESNATGGSNTALGFVAGQNLTGTNNTVLGAGAGFSLTTGNNNIDIGNVGVAGDANKIRIGKVGTQTATFVAGIHGATASGGVAVFVNSSGQLGTLTSSARFKQDIHNMDKASEAILALKPVTFRYKKELDPDGIPQFGLVAEEVEKVNPALITRDADGTPYTVRYEAINAMLLNEFLKEHHQMQDLKAIVAQQQKQIEALTSGLEKVIAQIEVTEPAPRTVVNNQ